MNEATEGFQEALELYRHLAQSSPGAYQPYVAATLNNLAALALETNNLKRAQADVEEALDINRELWKMNPQARGDDLAKSLLIDAAVLSRVEQPQVNLCSLVQEAKAVAYDSKLKKSASDQEAILCSAR